MKLNVLIFVLRCII